MGRRIWRLLLALAFAAAPLATFSAPADNPPLLVASSQISYQTTSWGRPVSGWGVNQDGSGWFMFVEGNVFSDHVVVTRRWSAAPGRFDQVSKLLKGPEAYVGKKLPCRLQITDGPQGAISWRREGQTRSLFVVYACTSRQADVVYQQLGRVDEFAKAWGGDASAIEDRVQGAK